MDKHYSVSHVLYLSDEFVRFYCLLAVKLHLLITRDFTCEILLSQRSGSFPSSYQLQPYTGVSIRFSI